MPNVTPDLAINLLDAVAQQSQGPTLWLLDEQAPEADLNKLALHTVRFVSNRYDVYHHLQNLGADVVFSDFEIAPSQYHTILYRISKEKAVVHHLINTAWRLLKPGGEFILSGTKNEGIKTYLDKAATLFGTRPIIKKQRRVYQGQIVKSVSSTGLCLDDQNYRQLRPLGEQNGVRLLSKPGLFGWNKIDQGSALLIEQLPRLLSHFKKPPQSLLDLGCGYGYLALLAQSIHPFQRLVATDNNAAALLACQANFAAVDSMSEVIADDCAQSVTESFDLILCNPPFHRGFELDKTLTDKFLATSARLLKPQGRAVFVVNRFIPLERLAKIHFQGISVLTANSSFSVIELRDAHSKKACIKLKEA